MLVAGVPLGEHVIRAAVVYLFAIVALRLAGKRELGQLSTFDLVVLLFFSSILQNGIVGDDNSITGGVVGAITLLAINYLVARVLYRHERIDALIEGAATPLIQDGEILHDNLKRELVTREELTLACHKQGVRRLEDVDLAILEPGGAISVFARQPTREELVEDEVLRRLDELQRALGQALARLEASPSASSGASGASGAAGSVEPGGV